VDQRTSAPASEPRPPAEPGPESRPSVQPKRTRESGDPGRHHGNRHGRSEHARLAVLRAADDLLVEKGFAAVTIEGIAAAAGVAKQTVYRWWSSKVDVLLDAFLDDAAQELTSADLGSLERDLPAHLRDLGRFLSDSDAGAVFKALMGHAQHDPEFAATFRAHYLDEQRRRDRLPLERAIERGELPADLDTNAAVDQLVGPIYHRALVTGDPVTDAFVDRIVSGFLSQYAADNQPRNGQEPA
jgi:AcrR family transcriptional regulator